MRKESGSRVLLDWSRNSQKTFFVSVNDVRSYELSDEDGTVVDLDAMSLESLAGKVTLRHVNSDLPRFRQMTVSPATLGADMLGGAVATGSTLLLDSSLRLRKEFHPRNPRASHALAWSALRPTRVAVGLERLRSDFSTLIWDVEAQGAVTEAANAAHVVRRPWMEMVMGEGTASLAWQPDTPNGLAVGAGAKWLRVYDLRQSADPHPALATPAHNRAVMGVCFDTLVPHRLATFSADSLIKVWDLRAIKDPVHVLNSGAHVLRQICWCPTRSGVLAVLAADDRVVRFWNINGLQQPVREVPVPQDSPAWLSWHPADSQRLLAVSSAGLVGMVPVPEAPTLSFAPDGTLALASRRRVHLADSSAPDDVARMMVDRARLDYGMDEVINARVCRERSEASLHAVWRWIKRVRRLSKTGDGESWLMRGMGASLRAAPRTRTDRVLHFDTYSSPQRSMAARLCGWKFDSIDELAGDLERREQFSRAVAICVFHLDVPRALRSLHRAADAAKPDAPDYHLIALALAGFDSGHALWRDSCASFARRLADPYLAAAFAFLAADAGDYAGVLGQLGLAFGDRLGFACRFLADAPLQTYLDGVTAEGLRAGDLDVLILTGLGDAGLAVVQAYLDRTGDVQTAALLACHSVAALQPDRNDARYALASRWIETYRTLLDTVGLSFARARLDVDRVPLTAPPKQLFARCYYCNQSLSQRMINPSKSAVGSSYTSGPESRRAPLRGCPTCNKPLPACAVCLTPLECAPPRTGNREAWSPNDSSSNFERWWCWCTECRHGGHASCLLQWTSSRPESVCPTPGCNCKCQ